MFGVRCGQLVLQLVELTRDRAIKTGDKRCQWILRARHIGLGRCITSWRNDAPRRPTAFLGMAAYRIWMNIVSAGERIDRQPAFNPQSLNFRPGNIISCAGHARRKILQSMLENRAGGVPSDDEAASLGTVRQMR